MERIEMSEVVINKPNINILYKILVVVACYSSFGAWFLATADQVWLSILYLVCFFLFYLFCPHYFRFEKKSKIWFVLLLLAILATIFHSNFYGFLSALISILPFYFIFNLKENYKSDILYFLFSFTSYCMAVSVCAYMLHSFGLSLPYSYLYVSDLYEYNNYYFFIERISLLDSILPLKRFHFIFYEPGYTGCLIALLFYIFSFDFKKYKQLYLLLLPLFFTVSLAGWLLTLAGFISVKIKNSKHRFLGLVIMISFTLLLALFFKIYKDGDNIVNLAIIERLEVGERDDGLISGYNRSTEYIRDYFQKDFIHSKDALFGRPDARAFFDEDENQNTNTDWISYVIRYGWFGLSLFLLFVFYPPLAFRRHRYDLMFFSGFFLLIFSQTIFLIYGYMYLTVFSLGCNEIIKRNETR